MKSKLNGWQRLWIVITILYLIPVVIGTMSYLPKREEILSSRTYAAIDAVAEYRKVNESDFRWDGAYSVRTTFYANLDDDQVFARLSEKWGSKVNLAVIEAEHQKRLDALPVAKAKIVGLGLLCWLIPAILVYVLGLSVAWIIQGFRHGNG